MAPIILIVVAIACNAYWRYAKRHQGPPQGDTPSGKDWT